MLRGFSNFLVGLECFIFSRVGTPIYVILLKGADNSWVKKSQQCLQTCLRM